MQKILPGSLIITVGLLLLTLSATAEPLLNGLALHKELGKDQFIGAIYSETLASEANALLASQETVRMELKVTADRGIRARRFNRMWIEGMAINNSSNTLSAQADNMVAFTNFFKGRLLQNDHIVFTASPSNGLDVSVNAVKLGNIPDDTFMQMLLSTWVGRVPLSSDYQSAVLAAGIVDDTLLQRFNAINPTDDRTQQIAQWDAPPKPAPAPTPKVVAVKPKTTPTPEPEPIAVASKDKVDIALPSLGSESSVSSSASSVSVSSVAATEEPTLSDEATELALLDAEEDEDNLPAFTAESLLANQLYFSNMNQLVQRNITYPRRAQRRGHMGNLRIAITLNRKGELLEATFLEKTPHNSLNNAAMKTVSKLTYPQIPEVMIGKTHDFTIPISFKLQ